MDKKDKKEEDLKNIKEPVFNIHKMPKGYKTGRFDLNHHTKKEKNPENNNNNNNELGDISRKNNKKIGIFIIGMGAIVVMVLLYLVFSYMNNSEFSVSKIFKFEKKNINENSEIVLPSENQPINNEDFVDDLNSIDEELVDNTNNTSTEDINTPVNLDELISVFVDSDGDGLSDDEEFILGSNHQNIDSDGDGFSDLMELLNLYDPISPGKLSDNINIDEYENKSFSYSILYPKSWDKRALSDESSLVLSIDESSFVQILVEKNESNLSIKDWYANRFMSIVDSSKIIKTKKWEGFYSEDLLAFYLTDNKLENIYTILYIFPENRPNSYINIFNSIVNSFTLK